MDDGEIRSAAPDQPAAMLTVDFIDESYEVGSEQTLTFGRAGDIVLDEGNDFMSRIVGVFLRYEGGWWLQNRSSSAELRVLDSDRRRTTLPPGTADPLTGIRGTVRFGAGRTDYEVTYRLQQPPALPGTIDLPVDVVTQGQAARPTAEFGVIPLNAEQRAMLAMFAEARLRDPSRTDQALPTNVDVAHRLGWSLKKLDRKLDYLCSRLADAGVRGLRGSRGGEANDRRRLLVDHVVGTGLITARDLTDATAVNEEPWG